MKLFGDPIQCQAEQDILFVFSDEKPGYIGMQSIKPHLKNKIIWVNLERIKEPIEHFQKTIDRLTEARQYLACNNLITGRLRK